MAAQKPQQWLLQSRQYTVDSCSKYFTVVDYLECGLDGLQDLVILRRDPGDLH